MAKGLGPEVRFVAIAPSMLPELTSGHPFIEKENKLSGPGKIEDYVRRTPLQRLCTPKDVADTIESVATKMKFYTGHVIVLDGGHML
jgi:NAD(P)-dependent dehydrogenase (short-subunit alcohol dehydrogenase family)